MSDLRLQRYLSQSGVAARRKAEDLITAGRVTVNGKVVRELGVKVDPEVDRVAVDGQGVHPEQHFYLLFNKPKGCIVSVSDDRGRLTVMDYLPNLPVSVAPVGRLDFYSEGVLLLTNDGDLAARLLAPKSHVAKTYHVKVHGAVNAADLTALRNGVRLDDGTITQACEVNVLPSDSRHTWLGITLYEGKQRQIHRMLEARGYQVDKLQRVAFGNLTFHGLRVGDARELDQQELNELRDLVGLDHREVARGRWQVRREATDMIRRRHGIEEGEPLPPAGRPAPRPLTPAPTEPATPELDTAGRPVPRPPRAGGPLTSASGARAAAARARAIEVRPPVPRDNKGPRGGRRPDAPASSEDRAPRGTGAEDRRPRTARGEDTRPMRPEDRRPRGESKRPMRPDDRRPRATGAEDRRPRPDDKRPMRPDDRRPRGESKRPMRPDDRRPRGESKRPMRPDDRRPRATGADDRRPPTTRPDDKRPMRPDDRRPRATGAGDRRPRATGAGDRRPRATGADDRRPPATRPDDKRPTRPDDRRPRATGADDRRPRATRPDDRRPRATGAPDRSPASAPTSRRPSLGSRRR
jgi:23S rRNA pseudouridine2605 synthase